MNNQDIVIPVAKVLELDRFLIRVGNDPRNIETYGYVFDLKYKWTGDSAQPMIRVYEPEDNHIIAEGPPELILGFVKDSLEHWHLKDPDVD